jgi:hypothetical protein
MTRVCSSFANRKAEDGHKAALRKGEMAYAFQNSAYWYFRVDFGDSKVRPSKAVQAAGVCQPIGDRPTNGDHLALGVPQCVSFL